MKFHNEGAQPAIQISYTFQDGSEIDKEPAIPGVKYHGIHFRDHGIGFDMAYSKKIFGMFQTLTPRGNYKGTGMGLALAQKVALAHKGFIIEESEESRGSVFSCCLRDIQY